MQRIILRLQRADNMDLPSLTVEGLVLRREEHAALERELRSRFVEITSAGEGGLFEAKTRLRCLPAPGRFRIVRVSRERSRRCPEVWLEGVSGGDPKESTYGPICWDGCREAARDLMGSIPETERASLDLIIDEFCQLEQESPQKVLILLLTAYALLQHQLTESAQRVRRLDMEEAINILAQASHHESLPGLARIVDGLSDEPTQSGTPDKANASRRRGRGPDASTSPGEAAPTDDDQRKSTWERRGNAPRVSEPSGPT
jgi:hypothetical protein